MLLFRVLELRVRQTTKALDEEHHGRNPGAGHLGGVVQRTGREPVHGAGDLADRLVAEPDERLVEEDRLDRPDPLPLDVDGLLGGEALARGLRVGEHRTEPGGVEMTLVEELLGRLDDRGDDSGLADDAARRAHGTVARRAAMSRISSASFAAPASASRRWSVGVDPAWASLAAPGDPVPLDAEGAEHDPEGQIERFEDRPLLDVELEVAALSSSDRASSALSRSTPYAASASGSATPSPSASCRSSFWSAIEPTPAARLEPKGSSRSAPPRPAQLTSRSVTGGIPSSATRRSTSAPATTLRQPSSQPPFGTESM